MHDIAAVACMILLLHVWYCYCMHDIADIAVACVMLLLHVLYIVIACVMVCDVACFG